MLLSFLPVTALADGAANCPDQGSCTHQAAIGSTHYDTLKQALQAAEENQTVTLLKSITINSNQASNQSELLIDTPLTLEGNGHTISAGNFSASAHIMGVEGTHHVTIQNLTIQGCETSKHCLNIYKSTDVTLKNLTLKDTKGGNGLLVNASAVTLLGSLTMSGNMWGGYTGNKINVGFGSNISGWTAGSKLTASHAVLQGVEYIYADSSDISRAEGQGGITIEPPDSFERIGAAEGIYYMPAAAVAQIGETTYATLAQAVAAVPDGGEIKLLRDSSGTGIGTFQGGSTEAGKNPVKNFTIDFDGFTYTCVGPAVGSSGTQSQAFHLEWNGKGEDNVKVTLKNGTITSTSGSGVKMLIQNYCDLTLDNMILDGTNLGVGQYVSSNNCGNVTIKDSTIIAPVNGYAFDSCDFSIYTGVTVTVLGRSVIQGKMGDTNDNGGEDCSHIVIQGGTFTQNTVDTDYSGATAPLSDYLAPGLQLFPSDSRFVVGKALEQISLNKDALTLYQGGIETLTATLTPSDAYQSTISWNSDQPQIAKVDSDGKVTALTPGEAVITAAVGDKTASCHVTVLPGATDDVLPSVEAPKVELDSSLKDLSAEIKDDITTAAGSVDADQTLSQAAQQQVEDLNNSPEKQNLLKQGAADLMTPVENVTLYTQTYLEVTATAVETAATSEIASITLDITPKVQVVASTAGSAAEINNGNSVVVRDAKEVEISASTQISVQLPQTFVNQLVYVKHQAGSGTYFYRGTADETGKLTFTNPHGFSPFTFSLTNGAAAEVNGIGYETLQEAIAAVSSGETIYLTADNSEQIQVNREITFTLDRNGHAFTGDIAAGSRCEMTKTENGNGTVRYSFARLSSSGSSQDYTVSVGSVQNGSVTVSPSRAEQGDTVTITVTPHAGYELDKLTVTGKNGGSVPLKNLGGGKYTFSMPGYAVTVQAVFASQSGLPFADVAQGVWYYDGVKFAYDRGLMVGTGPQRFGVDDPTTRAMIWTILAAWDGADTSGGDPWYAPARQWAMTNGVSDGTDPNGSITREQLATMLWRTAGSPGVSGSLSSYVDGDRVSPWAQTAMAWAVEQGILSGMGGGTLAPQGTATRAQVAVMLMQFVKDRES